jgi:hypothetical protein
MLMHRFWAVYQAGYQCCVASSIKRAVQLWHTARNGAAYVTSDRAMYRVARADTLSRAGVAPEDVAGLLADEGLSPYDALCTVREVGLVSEQRWPGPATYPDLSPDDMHREPPPHVLASAYDARGLQFHVVPWGRGGLREAIARELRNNCPVILAINGDEIADTDPGRRIVDVPQSGQNHMVLALSALDERACVLDNWWGTDWGDLGTWRASWDSLDRGAVEVLAVDYAPKGAT